MSAIALKQFDTAREIEQTLEINDVAINLDGTTVALNWYDLLRQTMWTRAATIVTAATGDVSYQPVDEDVENAGDFELEWVISYPDQTRLTVPTESRIAVTIYPAIVPSSP